MFIFTDIDLSTLNIGSEEQLQSLLSLIKNTQIIGRSIQTYSTKVVNDNNILINYYLPSDTIILCNISKVMAVTNNLTQIDEGFRVVSTGLVQLSLSEEVPITII